MALPKLNTARGAVVLSRELTIELLGGGLTNRNYFVDAVCRPEARLGG